MLVIEAVDENGNLDTDYDAVVLLDCPSHVGGRGLVRVLPEWSQQVGSVSMVWPESRHLSPRVQSFIEHAVESLGRDVPV